MTEQRAVSLTMAFRKSYYLHDRVETLPSDIEPQLLCNVTKKIHGGNAKNTHKQLISKENYPQACGAKSLNPTGELEGHEVLNFILIVVEYILCSDPSQRADKNRRPRIHRQLNAIGLTMHRYYQQ